MVQDNQLLTTAEFANRMGIAVSRVSKLIREGKIEAEKKSGKWMIHPSQLQVEGLQKPARGRKPKPKKKAVETRQQKADTRTPKPTPPKKETAPSTGRMYTVSEFVEMTYLTEFGVRQWLKQGRLAGRQNEKGEWLIEGASLQVPDVKRLVR